MKTHLRPTYPECEACKDLGDCKHPDVMVDGLGTPLPPEACIRFNEIMKETEKKKRHARNSA
jgi:hypothetical protein